MRAEALARRGDPGAAVKLARAAVGIASATDALLDHADARLALSAALRAAGRDAEADAEETRAFELWEAKGATLLAERSRHAVPVEPEERSARDVAVLVQPWRRRVRENRATASGLRMQAAARARDMDAIAALCADELQVVHHPTGGLIDREAGLNRWRMLLAAEGLELSFENLATLGDWLVLVHDVTSFDRLSQDDLSFGASRSSYVSIHEVNGRGQTTRVEVFAEDRLGDAIARLYGLYAELLPKGSERGRAAATARSVAIMMQPPDVHDRHAGVLSPRVELADHRTLGTWSARGPEALLNNFRSLLALSSEVAVRVDDVLALDPRGYLLRWTTSGIDRVGGGAYERSFLMLCRYGDDGLLAVCENFESADVAGASARFAALAAANAETFQAERTADAFARIDALGTAEAEPPFANAATRARKRMLAADNARDFAQLTALFAPGHRTIDRRRSMQVELELDAMLASFRPIYEQARWMESRVELLATRGDRLALYREWVSGEIGESGPSEVEYLQILETDEPGDVVVCVAFDTDACDAAYAELDARYAAGEAAAERRAAITRAFSSAFAARDWDALAALLAPDLVVHDHRLLGWETLHGPAAYVTALRSLVDLAPDVRLRIDHVSMAAPRFLYVTTWVGTRDGGAFESPSVIISELDADGRIRRFDQYDIDRLPEVRAGFEEQRPAASPTATDPLRIPPNAASRASDRNQRALEAQDWDALAHSCAPTMRFEDRRRTALVTVDRDLFLASNRIIASNGARSERTLLATAGDRLALLHLRWTGANADVGPFEDQNLSLIEVDAEGRIAAIVAFDLDDRRAASAEMSDRFFGGAALYSPPAAAGAGIRAILDHDLERLRAVLPEDFVVDDHRRTGMGRIEGAETFVRSLAALFELSPDLVIESLYTVAVCERGLLDVAHSFGTLAASGGAYESMYVRLAIFEGDRVIGFEMFEIEDLDRARARFEELLPDPLHIPPNAAARAGGCMAEAFVAHDWPTIRALVGPDFAFEDRRRRAQLEGDVELWIRNLEVIASWPGRRTETDLIGTLGDRIALARTTYAGGDDGAEFEGEFLRVLEIDANGAPRTVLHFDPEDRPAAFAEAHARFAAGEAAAIGGQAPIAAFVRAFARRDWEALGECLAPGAAIRDRRAFAVIGDLDRDAWLRSLRTLGDLSPDGSWEQFRILAWNRHGRVGVNRLAGTLRDGGPFEILFVAVLLTRGDHVERYEFFDVAEANRALARFEELCSERTRE